VLAFPNSSSGPLSGTSRPKQAFAYKVHLSVCATTGDVNMPVVQILLLEGRSRELKEKLIAEVTKAIARTLSIDEGEVSISLIEVPAENFGVGGASLYAIRRNKAMNE